MDAMTGVLARLVRVHRSMHEARDEALRRIPADRDEAVARAEAQYEQATSAANRAYERTEAGVRVAMDAERAAIAERDASERGEIERTHANRLASEGERHEQAMAVAEKKREEAKWLGDTVFESAARKAKQAYKAETERIERARETLARCRSLGELRGTGGGDEAGSDERGAAALPLDDAVAEAEGLERKLAGLTLPALVRSGIGAMLIVPIAAGGAAAGGAAFGWQHWAAMGAGFGIGLLIGAAGLVAAWLVGGRRERVLAGELLAAVRRGERAATHEELEAETTYQDRLAQARTASKAEYDKEYAAIGEAVAARTSANASAVGSIKHERAEATAALDAKTREETERLEARAQRKLDEARAARDEAIERAESGRAEAIAAAERTFEAEWAAAQRTWVAQRDEADGLADRLTREGTAGVIGRVTLAGQPVAEAAADGFGLEADRFASLPVVYDLPGSRPLLVEAGKGDRAAAVGVLRQLVLRLLTTVPAGRVRFTFVDPVGLGQSFAGFMQLSDDAPELVGPRIWTEPRHIEQRLSDLTEHMESVIQKYLREEFPTIEAYNAAAGEIAEPYRVLVLADYPDGLTEEAEKRLESIVASGPRCGVYVLASGEPVSGEREGPFSHARVLRVEGDGASFAEEPFAEMAVELDPEPTGEAFAAQLESVAQAASKAGRVEVPIESVMPDAGEVWTKSSAGELVVPVGKRGATRAQEFRLGRGTSQHALVAGKTGSGKSTLLHVLVTAAASWYGPDELELYLVDFKKGVEFQAYADGRLPHVKAVAIESDREFGISVLRRLDEELKRRGELFREADAQDVAGFRRERPGVPMPRVLLVIDEFQEFFVEDDAVAGDASLLLDRLVRQGRAFGVHVLLGSQTLSGAYTLARSTVGQMAVRIALQCSETDSYLILSEDNAAARLLTRPGEAIYNDANGLVEGNSPFQVAWMSDKERDGLIDRVGARRAADGVAPGKPVVFEGNTAADLTQSVPLRRALGGEATRVPTAWVGEPVAIAETVGAKFRRRSGANLIIVGQQQGPAQGMVEAAAVSLAAQADGGGSVVVVDPTPEDEDFAGRFGVIAEGSGGRCRVVGWREADEQIRGLAAELDRRLAGGASGQPSRFLLLHGLHRLRSLRRKEDDFSFSMEPGEGGESVSAALRRVLVDGPGVGLHVVCWCDTLANAQRTFERGFMTEFGERVLMLMSAADSASMIDSVAASKLGPGRAIFFDDESGVGEKFRPFGPLERGVLASLGGGPGGGGA